MISPPLSIAEPSTAPAPGLPGLDEIRRRLSRLLPAGVISDGGGPLEMSTAIEPPFVAAVEVIEDDTMRVHRPPAGREPPFPAFLDGTQRSELVWQSPDGVPVLSGTVAAAIREWTAGQAATWRHEVRHALYAPRNAMPDEWGPLGAAGMTLVDVSAGAPELADAHPTAQRDAALDRVRRDREALELHLAHAWCAERSETLFLDGGLRGSEALARSPLTVGVIKSHQTLYGDRAARRVIHDLAEGERTSVFVIASRGREPVASWYLRLRGRERRNLLWGLVRVEVRLERTAPPAALAARADGVSRRILAERMPTAHPDARWHTMVYGIRDCEVFLRAIQ